MPTPAPSIPNRSADRPEDGDFKTELLALIPFLRAFARSLTGNQEGADDLAQETWSRPGRVAPLLFRAPI